MAKKIGHDDIDKFHDYSIHIPTRTIFMGTENISTENDFEESGVDCSMAERNLKNIHILEAMSSDPITIIMNNIGGDFYHGMAIYDAIKYSSVEKITIKVFGHAMSMGSIILQAADERIMAPNAKQMVHYGYTTLDGESKTVEKKAREDRDNNRLIEEIYLDRVKEKIPDFTMKALKKLLDRDTFLSPEESVRLGLADKILGDDE